MIRLLTGKDFSVLQNFLSSYKTQCMFLLSNLKSSGVDYKGETFQGEYFGFFFDEDREKSELSGVIVHYWNGNIMMCVPNRAVLEDLVAFFVSKITRPIEGVLGPNDQAAYVIEKLGLSNKIFSINSNEGLYELDLGFLQKPQMSEGLKVVRAEDIKKEILIKWIADYDVEALGMSDRDVLGKDIESDVNRRLQEKNTWILLSQGVPVSLCGFNARIEDMVQVGPVWTPVEYRRRHFARMLLAHILFEEKAKGVKKSVLFTNNKFAVKSYLSIGFKKIGNFRLSLLKKQ